MSSRLLAILYLSFALVLPVGCTGSSSNSSDLEEVPLILLAQEYSVDVRVLGFDCPLGHLRPNGFRGVAEVEQIGNTVVWRQQAVGPDGEADPTKVWVLNGRLCPEGSGAVLRLRGGRVSRIAEGDLFCRADLRIPAAHAICPVQTDTCSDPNTIQLHIDPCSDRLVGGFRSCMVFSEACLGQESCRFAMQWDAVSSDQMVSSALGERDACVPLELPPVEPGCPNECSRCGC